MCLLYKKVQVKEYKKVAENGRKRCDHTLRCVNVLQLPDMRKVIYNHSLDQIKWMMDSKKGRALYSFDLLACKVNIMQVYSKV